MIILNNNDEEVFSFNVNSIPIGVFFSQHVEMMMTMKEKLSW